MVKAFLLVAGLCLGVSELAVTTGLSTHGLVAYHDAKSPWVLLLAPLVIAIAARSSSAVVRAGVVIFAGGMFANLLSTHLWERGVPDYIYIGGPAMVLMNVADACIMIGALITVVAIVGAASGGVYRKVIADG